MITNRIVKLLFCIVGPPGSYVSPPQLWRIAALKYTRIAHARDWTVQRNLHHEQIRNSVLVFPLKVYSQNRRVAKLTCEPGGNCTVLTARSLGTDAGRQCGYGKAADEEYVSINGSGVVGNLSYKTDQMPPSPNPVCRHAKLPVTSYCYEV